MSLPLSGLKVLDLSRLLPGPYATLVLADLGASVDKLEPPEGDYTRQVPPLVGETSSYFLALNRNKRSLSLDLKTPHGVSALRRLVKSYDVLVESFRPGVMDRLGVGWSVLSTDNPKLVMCSISGYGETGPDSLRAGHDLNYIARSGVLAYGGLKGGAPALPGAQMADIGGSLFSIVAILAALHERQRTGRGRHLDVSMMEGSMAFVHMQLAARLLMGSAAGPLERGVEPLNGGLPCYGVYRTLDSKWLAVGALEPKFLVPLCAALGRPDLATAVYGTPSEREQVRQAFATVFASRTLTDWVETLRPLDVCVEPVNEGDAVLADPQLLARGVLVQAGDVMHLRTPLNFGAPITPCAPLGAHSAEILSEAGFSSEEIASLAGPGRAAERPPR